MKEEKRKRRAKREAKNKAFFARARAIMGFRKRQFEGKGEPKGSPFETNKGYTPDKDPNESNNDRVRKQRKLSGRFKDEKDTKATNA